MILQNTCAAMITINTTPFISKKDALQLIKNGEALTYSRINIPPTECRDIPDEFCDCDFVRNLIEKGDLIRRAKEDINTDEDFTPQKSKKSQKLTEKMTAKLKKAREDADLSGVAYDEDWTADQINKAIENHFKR